MRSFIFSLSGLLAVLAGGTSATVINVPGDYPTIQEGIDVSADGDTVLVQPGTYVENINFNGHNIVLGSLFLITQDSSYIYTTIIDGDDAQSVVTFQNGEGFSTLIIGFTIQNGISSFGAGIYCSDSNPEIANNIIRGNIAGGHGRGGGIYCSHSNPTISSNLIWDNFAKTGGGIECFHSNPLIAGNTIRGNTANQYDGGGILCTYSDPLIDNNLIRENSTRRGGAISCHNSNPTIISNIINDNSADWSGGGIYCDDSNPAISRNTITGNISEDGGGICCSSSHPQLKNNVIVSNISEERGGGICCTFDSNPLIENNTVYSNISYDEGGGIFCYGSRILVKNTIFWENEAVDGSEIFVGAGWPPAVTFCDIQGGWDGEGNIDVEPRFRNPDEGDFRLKSTACGNYVDSPCIDSGHPEILDSLLDCSWGLGAGHSDIGAYGGGIVLPHQGRTINIPEDLPTIQTGINSSMDGDTILVQPGLYSENLHFYWHNIVVGSLFLTTADTSYISLTIIDGGSQGSVISFEDLEQTEAAIIGFTIQNGSDYRGGGIYCHHSDPIIGNNKIVGNTASSHGGGLYCYLSQPTIINTSFVDNSASGNGGGFYCRSAVSIHGNILTGNSAGGSGGGILSTHSNTVISSNIIDGNSASFGGGICCYGGPVISNNTFNFNSATEDGGGIYCEAGADPRIIDNAIISNIAACGGGGIYLNISVGPSVAENLISGNESLFGAGIYCLSDADIRNNIINDNSAPFGGGIYCLSSRPRIIGNRIFGNDAMMRGAGVYCSEHAYSIIRANEIYENVGNGISCWYSSPSIQNNIITRNMASVGAGLYNIYSHPTIINSIFWGNESSEGSGISVVGEESPVISYSNIQGGWEGEGNIDVDPLFRDPENGDFHLMSTACGDPYDSPCIDAGHPDILDSLLDCSWGLGTVRSDMGAYGGGDSVTVGIDQDDIPIPHVFSLFQSYPNPFNAATVIRYALAEPADVRIEVYDILGRRVETLLEEKERAGYHRITWNPGEHPSGVYFARLVAGEKSQNIKMVLLK